MGILVHFFLWVIQDLYHQPYGLIGRQEGPANHLKTWSPNFVALGFRVQGGSSRWLAVLRRTAVFGLSRV